MAVATSESQASVWDALVGQPDVVAAFQRAVDASHAHAAISQDGGTAALERAGDDSADDDDSAGDGGQRAQVAGRSSADGSAMTHAWLVTGPPGSGRSVAAVAFAAALVCPDGGCGACPACRQAMSGSHPDVEIVRPERLSYGVDAARDLVVRASRAPSLAGWHVLVVEDADRMTPEAVSALLKAIEEPTERTVWLLCAPSAEDVLPTIRSRTRAVTLRTPATAEVAAVLIRRYGVDDGMAAFAARASQGHIGRARALATDEGARLRRQEVLHIPTRIVDLPSCLASAADLLEAATEDAGAITDPQDVTEREQLMTSYGRGADGVTATRIDRLARSQSKELEAEQKSRRTRVVREQVDRALLDLQAFYRDVLAVQYDADVPLVNEELRPVIERLAAAATPDATVRRMEAIRHARTALSRAVAPLLALEAMTVSLFDPTLGQ